MKDKARRTLVNQEALEADRSLLLDVGTSNCKSADQTIPYHTEQPPLGISFVFFGYFGLWVSALVSLANITVL